MTSSHFYLTSLLVIIISIGYAAAGHYDDGPSSETGIVESIDFDAATIVIKPDADSGAKFDHTVHSDDIENFAALAEGDSVSYEVRKDTAAPDAWYVTNV